MTFVAEISTPANVALKAVGIAKTFGGNKVLDGIDFNVSTGEIVALIGPNGSGKTTLLNILTGHLTADKGVVDIRGRSIAGLSPHVIARLGVGRTFQEARIFGRLTVLDNISVASGCSMPTGTLAESCGEAPRKQRWTIENLLPLLMLRECAHQKAASLSYGQKKLLSLAVCLASNPVVLLMDEPLAGVQIDIREVIINCLRTLQEDAKAIVFVEHDTEAAFALANRVVVLAAGRTIANGAPSDVRMAPSVLEAYLS